MAEGNYSYSQCVAQDGSNGNGSLIVFFGTTNDTVVFSVGADVEESDSRGILPPQNNLSYT